MFRFAWSPALTTTDEELGETVRRNIVLLFREHKKVLPFLRYLFRLEIRGTLKSTTLSLLVVC